MFRKFRKKCVFSTFFPGDALRKKPVLVLWASLLAMAPLSNAQVTLGPVTVGAGLQTSFESTNPTGGATTNQFLLNSVRLYVSGPVTDNIKFMFNTDYDGPTNKIGVLDAVAEFSTKSPEFNIWAGRFLPPSDRANLYGPYYANEWAVYTDGIQDGYPFVFDGRDNGVVYWGDFAKKIKVSVGAFDGKTATGSYKVLGAARVQIDFWDKEEGYYLNGTYYGDKNLLALAGATQFQGGNTAATADFLMEKKLASRGVFTIESEYSNYSGLGGYQAAYKNSQGAYGLAAYLFPKKLGVGQIQIMGKYAAADFTHGTNVSYDQHTAELNVNYVIKQFKARVMTFYKDTRFNRVVPNFWQAGIGLQVQM